MKIKQFFIDNKVKIKKLCQFLLCIFCVLFYSITIFACGYNSKQIIEDSNKKELVNRKERVVSTNITYINLLTNEALDSTDYGYINELGNFVPFDLLLLTNFIPVVSHVDYVYKANNNSATYMGAYDGNYNWVTTIIAQDVFTIPSGVSYLRIGLAKSEINNSRFYQGQIVYNYYLPPIQNILDSEYDEGYDTGYNDSLVNIFTYSSFDNMPVLAILEDDNIVNLDSTDYTYDPIRFFKNNYVDLQYLRSLSIPTSRYYIYWADSNYLLSDLNLSISGSTNNYNILVNNQSYVIGLNPVFIDSSELLNMISFDSSFLDNTRLTNHSIMFSQGFNKGYNTGYDFGYSDGSIYTEDYYDELILPSVRNEYYEIGYDSGYDSGYSDGSSYTENYYDTLVLPGIKTEYYNNGLLDGRAESNVILKPFELMSSAVEPVIVVLSSEIAPGITIGTIALIPLAVSMIVFLLKGLVM